MIDLNKPIEIGKKKNKNKKAQAAAQPVVFKTYINFAEEKKEKTNMGLAIPGTILIVLLAAAFAKFGVVDRFARLSEAEARVYALEKEINDGTEKINNADELTARFYHYTWSGMTEEETERISRVEVADLIMFVGNNGVEVNNAMLSGGQLVLSITAEDLQTISALSARLNSEDIVESSVVNNARMAQVEIKEAKETKEADETKETDETKAAGDTKEVVDAEIIIYLKSASDMEKEEAGTL